MAETRLQAATGGAGTGQTGAPAPEVGLTEKAAAEIRRIIKENGLPPETCLRVGAKGGGCSGFSYVLDFDQKGKTAFDEEFVHHGVRVVVDKKSLKVMEGTVVDYQDADLLNRGFTFVNPSASGSCGCGTSFSV